MEKHISAAAIAWVYVLAAEQGIPPLAIPVDEGIKRVRALVAGAKQDGIADRAVLAVLEALEK